jgi:hypothetical protein
MTAFQECRFKQAHFGTVFTASFDGSYPCTTKCRTSRYNSLAYAKCNRSNLSKCAFCSVACLFCPFSSFVQCFDGFIVLDCNRAKKLE